MSKGEFPAEYSRLTLSSLAAIESFWRLLVLEEELIGLIAAGELVDSNTLATHARLKTRRLIR
jgi:hypothetical protein